MTTKIEEDGWISDLVGALCDPIIVFDSPWKDDLPDWIKPQITLERLIMNMRVSKEGGVPVGDTEVLAYIFPRTLEAPMTEQWTRIYIYVFNQAMKFKRTEVPEDLKSETLDAYDMQELDQLRHWIYEKRVQHRREKARVERRQEKEAAAAEELETKPVQASFF